MSPKDSMRQVGRSLNDYLLIRTEKGKLRPYQTLADHERSRAWLEAELAKQFEGPTVVVTHHAPHFRSIHQRFAGNPINGGFVSDLTPLLSTADLWLHGHVHDSFNYEVDGCRVVANPAGYVRNFLTADTDKELKFENTRFSPRLVLEIAKRSV